MKPVNQVVFRTIILKNIEKSLSAIKQWSEMQQWENAAKYAAKADALIELLEVDDCGSIGGFDAKRGQDRDRHWTLTERYDWLRKARQGSSSVNSSTPV